MARDPSQRLSKRIGYHVLLALLLSLFLLVIWEGLNPGITGPRRVFDLAVILAAFFALAHHRVFVTVMIVFGALHVALMLIADDGENLTARGGDVAGIVFTGSILLAILVDVFREQRVTGATLSGAACGYLLLGVLWTHAYRLVYNLEPGSFQLSTGAMPVDQEFFYFSFVTVTTLGFGDFVPVTEAARSLTVLEAIIGQLYLVVLVARLVGLHLQATSAEQGAA